MNVLRLKILSQKGAVEVIITFVQRTLVINQEINVVKSKSHVVKTRVVVKTRKIDLIFKKFISKKN